MNKSVATAIDQSLADLVALDRDALVIRWRQEFGHPAPARCRIEILRQIIGWQMQATALGGLSASDRRRLRQITPTGPQMLLSGSRLIRVWQGETHQVTVLEEGFAYAGRNWRSLSAIARAITGTAWSGPVFFGLKA